MSLHGFGDGHVLGYGGATTADNRHDTGHTVPSAGGNGHRVNLQVLHERHDDDVRG